MKFYKNKELKYYKYERKNTHILDTNSLVNQGKLINNRKELFNS